MRRWKPSSRSTRAIAATSRSATSAERRAPKVSGSLPLHHDLARLAAAHDVEGPRELGVMQLVCNDGSYIETALQQAGHLVPSLEHLPAIDALDGEALEDDLVPVDGDVFGWNAEECNAASVM